MEDSNKIITVTFMECLKFICERFKCESRIREIQWASYYEIHVLESHINESETFFLITQSETTSNMKIKNILAGL